MSENEKTKKKRRKKIIKIKLSKKEKVFRIIIRNKPVFGINSHGMYEHCKTLHIHLGDKYKIALYPKDLIGLWKKKGKKYARIIPKDTKKRKRRRREENRRSS
ncbi:hypothetical protein DRP04_09200 [Archaeoglobales archaeon]|nr:MAG: hypothetical protein DRP04_09200 [Archaeoglobales archaeon]